MATTTDYINSGSFTLGPTNSVNILETLTNNPVDWGLLTQINWHSNAVQTRNSINLMRGLKYDLIFNQGWQGTFSLQRVDSRLDEYWSALEAQVRAGLPYPTFTIIQRIKETDGTNTQLKFSNASITYDDAGTYENEAGVVMALSFTAPVRLVTKN